MNFLPIFVFIKILITDFNILFLSGERLVLYLAVADLLFSIIHSVDHLYSVLQIKRGFEEFCIFAGFLLEVFNVVKTNDRSTLARV